MYPVSTEWHRTLKSRAHTRVSRLDVEVSGQVEQFPIVEGTITQNYDDPTRWGFDVTIVDSEARTYAEMYALVSPFLSRLRPWSGVKHADGSTELVPCGEMFVKDLEVVESQGGAIVWRLNSFDASTRLQSPMPAPFVIPAGRDPTSLVAPLLTPRFPRLTIVTAPTSYLTEPMILRERSVPWTEAQRLVASTGLDFTVNRVGEAVMQPRILDATAADHPAWHFDEAIRPDFAEPARRLTFDDAPNVVIVSGSHPNATGVTGIAFDSDPRSPTYRYSPDYGENVFTVDSDRVFTNAQADALAEFVLSKKLGPQDQVTFTAVVNAALDVGDVVLVSRARLGLVAEPLIVTQLEVPLGVTEFMRVTCRRSIFTNLANTPL